MPTLLLYRFQNRDERSRASSLTPAFRIVNDQSAMSAPLNLVEIRPGSRLRLHDGRVLEVVSNPADGVWLFCSEPGGDGDDAVCAPDIAELLTTSASPGD